MKDKVKSLLRQVESTQAEDKNLLDTFTYEQNQESPEGIILEVNTISIG